jgi:hypothetical protein
MIPDERFDALVRRAVELTKEAVEKVVNYHPINAADVMCKILDLLVANEVSKPPVKARSKRSK